MKKLRIMKTLLIVCALVFVPSILSAQHRLGAPVEASWDYTLADVTLGGVIRFEVKLDGGPWVNTGLPPNATSYVYVIPALGLTVGPHTAYVRACNSQECSAEPSPNFVFTVVRPIPVVPKNFKVQPGTVIVSNERILQIARAYTLLVREEELRENELVILAQRYRGPIPVTLESLMAHLDNQLLLLR